MIDPSRYASVRALTHALAARLSPEDAQIQSMPDASPTKWHLAHTTWFFETFVLGKQGGYTPFDPNFGFLFNSYYQAVGPMHTRAARGVLSRPRFNEVMAYREEIDARMQRGFEAGDFDAGTMQLIELGLHHEQQHQELILTDIKHAFACNAVAPAYAQGEATPSPETGLQWIAGAEGVVEVGHSGEGFHFDNEGPQHRVFLEPHRLASRLVSNAEYLAFMQDGGYGDSRLWLSPAWALIQADQWAHPFYWRGREGAWTEFTLRGEVALDPNAPVSHLSYYEADAYARWAQARLPTEFEWEAAAAPREAQSKELGRFVDDATWHPRGGGEAVDGLTQLFGDLWEWTNSSYAPYPGYNPPEGPVGEYNGKFMVDQYVLRGGSIASSPAHLRASYRNFFHVPDRWQFTGLRLARSS